ncbi:hypothetical protein BU25DRAFT_456154 [Macroventuria anomochaeta]|uniref:Uncharacterized protein n=1 Tax=Macroventuria anomochaeta TaxID=301207 RepID=A0ACB6S8X0_9PLEO|nr:uncharacterized protein BU25DRAFT_456154 [Macroventuria anomochaeta]KAF2630418.1 hypothetical protein BU25DRAFT_456154 [Macroventuria anomochaeta]
MRPASVQPSASDYDEKNSSETQEQQTEDVFTTMSPKNQAEPVRFSLSNDTHKSSEESPLSKPKSDLSAETFEATGEPHIKTPRAEEAADLGPDNLHYEASPGQDKPKLETPGRIRNKSPADTLIMHKTLRKKFASRLTPKEEEGYIYVVKDLNRPHLCKIGRAKESELRVATIENSCGFKPQLVYSRLVGLYIRTEALTQGYLSDLCQPYFCKPCNQTHHEWFEAPNELAIAAVKKWVDFMCRESPYDPRSKELRPFWSIWLKVHDLASADLDVDEFRMWWDRIISPSELDHFKYKLNAVQDILWKFFWPVYATLAWTVTFIAFQHPVAFLLMVTSVVGTFVSMSYDFPLRNASTSSRKTRSTVKSL